MRIRDALTNYSTNENEYNSNALKLDEYKLVTKHQFYVTKL